jgi:hypothetical protein
MPCTTVDFYETSVTEIAKLYDELAEISAKQTARQTVASANTDPIPSNGIVGIDGYSVITSVSGVTGSNYVPINGTGANGSTGPTGSGGGGGGSSTGYVIQLNQPITWISTSFNGWCPDPATPVEMKKDSSSNGCTCTKCNELYPYAETPIGKDFICYGCRMVW